MKRKWRRKLTENVAEGFECYGVRVYTTARVYESLRSYYNMQMFIETTLLMPANLYILWRRFTNDWNCYFSWWPGISGYSISYRNSTKGTRWSRSWWSRSKASWSRYWWFLVDCFWRMVGCKFPRSIRWKKVCSFKMLQKNELVEAGPAAFPKFSVLYYGL